MTLFFIKGNICVCVCVFLRTYNKFYIFQYFPFFRFVLIGRNATYSTDHTKLRLKLIQQTSFHGSTAAVIMLPSVKDANISIYEQYVKRATVCKFVAQLNIV